MKKCCIISAGDVNLTLLNKKKNEYDFFIAADAGYEKAIEANITPDLLVGDFDSLSQSAFPHLSDIEKTDGPQFVRFPIDKDYSDTYLALEEGIKRGFNCFDIYGALGGDRFSHTMANIQTMYAMKKKQVNVTVIGQNEILYFLQNETLTLTLPPLSTFSVFSLEKETLGVTITGAKYNLENTTLSSDFPLGLSNKTVQDEVLITVGEGCLLVITEFSSI